MLIAYVQIGTPQDFEHFSFEWKIPFMESVQNLVMFLDITWAICIALYSLLVIGLCKDL